MMFTHISFSSHGIRSPNRCTPNSISLGAASAATSAKRGLSVGFNISVWERLLDELLSCVACAVKCPSSLLISAGGSAPGARMKGAGKRPKTSSTLFLSPGAPDSVQR